MKEKTAFFHGGAGFRRCAAALVLALILVLTASGGALSVYAASSDGLKLVETTPADGYKRVQAQNVMVKLHFNNDVSSSAAKKTNEDMIRFTDSKGKKVKFRLYYDSEDPKEICVLSVNDLKVNKQYKITVDPDLTDSQGNTLGKTETIGFTTRQSGGGIVYFLLMAAMVVVMVVISIREQRKKLLDEQVSEGKPAAAKQRNPYKLAKEKGISVEEATRIINKEKAKEQKKIDKKVNKQKRREEKLGQEIDEQLEEYQVFRVHTKRVVKYVPSSKKKKSSGKNGKGGRK